jgi:hypothetical protein
MNFPLLSLWTEVVYARLFSKTFNVGDKVGYTCQDGTFPSRAFNITCLGTLGWDVPDPLPVCQAPRPSPDYVVARNNQSFNGSILQATLVCDNETGLSLPWVHSRLDMYQILANVTPLGDGTIVPIGNNIRYAR